MKIKFKILVLLFTGFVFQISVAQTIVLDENDTIDTADCAAKIKKAKEMYAEVFKSESSVAYRKIKNDFYSKLYKGTDLNNAEGATCIERTLNWVENNIEQTAFQNFEEAKNIWQKKTEARELFEKESTELQKYLKELNKTCPKQDCQQLFLDLMNEYGNEFFM